MAVIGDVLPVLRLEDVASIVGQITYKPNWEFLVGIDANRFYVQVNYTGPEPWKSGKRFLSAHMCRQEIVGSVFSLIMSAEEHEVREAFRYKGASIYNAHLDPDVLVEVARKKSSFNVREDAMSMEEPLGPQYRELHETPSLHAVVLERFKDMVADTPGRNALQW